MAEDSKMLPAPEGQSGNDWLLPILVFFGAFVVLLLLLLGRGGDSGLSVAEKPAAQAAEAPGPQPNVASNASIAFVEPTDGQTVPQAFKVVLQATYVTVEPAGELHTNAGHFHILVDVPFVDAGEVIPKDENHIHLGDGSKETELTLTPGEHTLRLQLADGAHRAYPGDGMRAEIHITVSA